MPCRLTTSQPASLHVAVVEFTGQCVHVEGAVVKAGGVAGPTRGISIAHIHVVDILVQHPQGRPQASGTRVSGLGDVIARSHLSNLLQYTVPGV